jgi:SanA protein
MSRFKRFIIVSAIIAGAVAMALSAADAYVAYAGRPGIYENVKDLPQAQAVLVLGAAVHRNGQLSAVFRDRASKALEVYRAGKAKKILVSGDHSAGNYDEVDAAKKFLLKNGVSGQDLFVDYDGFDTYSSVYRAKEIFQVGSLIISTQEFHLPRALYLARSLGINVCGIEADSQNFNLGFFNFLRENAARAKSFWDITTNAKPEFLGNPVPITGDGRASWD